MPTYSERTLGHIENPHRGCLPSEADVAGRSGRLGQGPFVALHLKLSEDTIVAASFQTYGCPAAIACGSALAKLAEGITLAEAGALTERDLSAELGGLPRGKVGCLGLAMRALRDALGNVGVAHGS